MIHARDDYNRIQDPENKIGEDEPVFLLRAQDVFFIPMLRYYRTKMVEIGNIAMADKVDEQIQRAQDWEETHKVKLPDL